MSIFGIDVAWAKPTVAQIKATGAQWVAGYLSPDSTKNLTYQQIADRTAAGLATVAVWESSAARALQGFAAGKADAKTAEAQRKTLGLPDTMIIHFAVDTDTGWDHVLAYFQGVATVLPQARVGVYGGLKVITGAAAAGYRYLWQTLAWSGGVWHPKATIRQTGGTVLGQAADNNYAQTTDYGQYPRPPLEDIVTPADITAVAAAAAAAVWNHTETPKAGSTVRMGAVLGWMDTVHAGQTAQIGALTATVTALSQAVASGSALTPAEITAAAQAGATAALAELGHVLDGTKP